MFVPIQKPVYYRQYCGCCGEETNFTFEIAHECNFSRQYDLSIYTSDSKVFYTIQCLKCDTTLCFICRQDDNVLIEYTENDERYDFRKPTSCQFCNNVLQTRIFCLGELDSKLLIPRDGYFDVPNMRLDAQRFCSCGMVGPLENILDPRMMKDEDGNSPWMTARERALKEARDKALEVQAATEERLKQERACEVLDALGDNYFGCDIRKLMRDLRDVLNKHCG